MFFQLLSCYLDFSCQIFSKDLGWFILCNFLKSLIEGRSSLIYHFNKKQTRCVLFGSTYCLACNAFFPALRQKYLLWVCADMFITWQTKREREKLWAVSGGAEYHGRFGWLPQAGHLSPLPEGWKFAIGYACPGRPEMSVWAVLSRKGRQQFALNNISVLFWPSLDRHALFSWGCKRGVLTSLSPLTFLRSISFNF